MVPTVFTHRCRSRQIFGGAKYFYPNFPKLAWKVSGNSLSKHSFPHRSFLGWPQRFSYDSPHAGCQYTKTKQRWTPFLVVFSGSLPRILGILQNFSDFALIFQYVSQIFQDFSRIFRDFSRIFDKSKILWMRLDPHFLHQWFYDCFNLDLQQKFERLSYILLNNKG